MEENESAPRTQKSGPRSLVSPTICFCGIQFPIPSLSLYMNLQLPHCEAILQPLSSRTPFFNLSRKFVASTPPLIAGSRRKELKASPRRPLHLGTGGKLDCELDM